MKKYLIVFVLAALIAVSCTMTKPVAKSDAYTGMYEEKPLTVLLMPPVNRSTNVEAKEYFHSSLNVPLANLGYYVIPPFLSIEMLKRESAYDSELFLNSSLKKFGEVFGADIALFTIINKWDKSSIASKVDIEVEYTLKSIVTNEVLYSRKGAVTYDTSVSTGAGGAIGLLADLAASAINTAATKYVNVARSCNVYTFSDLPAGKYHEKHSLDGAEPAGKKEFKVNLN